MQRVLAPVALLLTATFLAVPSYGQEELDPGFELILPGYTLFLSNPPLYYAYFVPEPPAANPRLDYAIDEGAWLSMNDYGQGYWVVEGEALADGPHAIAVRARADGIGDQVRSASFTIENDPPTVTLDTVASPTPACEFIFAGTASDGEGAGIYEVQVRVDDRNVGEIDYDGELIEDRWEIASDLTGFLAGSHQVVAIAQDNAINAEHPFHSNHASTEAQELILERDCIPRVEILSPASGSVIRGEIDVLGTIEWPTSQVGRLEFYVDGEYWGSPDPNGPTWTQRWNAWWWDDGPHTVTARACRAYGDLCVEDSIDVPTDHLDAFGENGNVTCVRATTPFTLGGLPPPVATDCDATFWYTTDPMATDFRVVLEWDPGLVEQLDDLALVVRAGDQEWEERGVNGNRIEIETWVAAPESLEWEIRIEASGQELVDLAYEQAFHLTVDFAYWWHELPEA